MRIGFSFPTIFPRDYKNTTNTLTTKQHQVLSHCLVFTVPDQNFNYNYSTMIIMTVMVAYKMEQNYIFGIYFYFILLEAIGLTSMSVSGCRGRDTQICRFNSQMSFENHFGKGHN